MAKYKVRLEWKMEEWYEIEADSEKDAYEAALNAPIVDSKSLGIHLAEVHAPSGKVESFY